GRWLACPCGWRTRARYDSSRRRWRHLDFGACKVFLEADRHRVDCRACLRVRTEHVPWARPGARHTRDFEDVAGWLAQRMDTARTSSGCNERGERVAAEALRRTAGRAR